MRILFNGLMMISLIGLGSLASAACDDSQFDHNSQSLADIHNYLQDSSEVYQCVEQEVLDPLVDPWRVQSLAMQLCTKSLSCLQYLRQKTAEISALPIDHFEKMPAVQLWGEIYKYSGIYRKRGPALSDLPLDQSPEEIFAEIKKAELAKRSMTKSKAKQISCAAAFLIIGPTKLKGLQLAKIFVAPKYSVELAHGVEKILKNNRLPELVKSKFLKWQSEIEEKGLVEVKKTSGYHDEPIRTRPGQHSVRLNQGYRVFYETTEEKGVIRLKVLDISVHEY